MNETERRQLVAAVGSLRKIREIHADDLRKLVSADVAVRVLNDLSMHTDARPPVIPLVVPIRFDAENGNAEDLRPINSK